MHVHPSIGYMYARPHLQLALLSACRQADVTSDGEKGGAVSAIWVGGGGGGGEIDQW